MVKKDQKDARTHKKHLSGQHKNENEISLGCYNLAALSILAACDTVMVATAAGGFRIENTANAVVPS